MRWWIAYSTRYKIHDYEFSRMSQFSGKNGICTNTVKLEMFADINVCEFVISKVFVLLKFAIFGLPKVNFVFPTYRVLLLFFLIRYIR